MSVFRNAPVGGGKPANAARTGKPGGGSITVKCPKCQTNIVIAKLNGHEAIRCHKCNYPMIRQDDLLSIVTACRKLTNPNQADNAARILRFMVEYMPEAGTALGELAGKYTLPLSESDKWSALTTAYAGGDESAREWLNLMCQTSPDKYQQCLCKNCGAPKYVLKNTQIKSPCVYCQQTD